MSRLESRIPPLVIALAAAGVMWPLAQRPSLAVPLGTRGAIVFVLAIVAVAIVVAGVIEFHRARTTVNPLRPEAASAFVVSGIYRVTRNPMYVGMAIVLLAWAIYLSHPLSLLGVVAFVAYIQRYQIAPEEKALRALFPGAFEAYSREVRRWL